MDPAERHEHSRQGTVREILDGSEAAADFALAISEAVYALYSWLNKPTHTIYRNEAVLRGALLTGDGLLLFILGHRQK